MVSFKKFILNDEIESLFSEVDNYLENIKYIDPITGKGWRSDDRWRQLDSIVKDEVKKGTNINRIWITFSDIRKFGQRTDIRYSKSTPVGIFAFPVKFALEKKESVSSVFAKRKFIHIFKTKKKHFEVGGKSPSYSKNKTYKKNAEKFQSLKDKFPEFSIKEFDVKQIHQENYNEIIDYLYQHVKDQNKLESIKQGMKSFFDQWIKNILIGLKNYQKDPFIINPEEAFKQKFYGLEFHNLMEVLIQDRTLNSYDENHGMHFFKIYDNIGNDLSANLNPEFISHWNENKVNFHHEPLPTQANFPEHYAARKNPQYRVSFNEIKRFDDGIISPYVDIQDFISQNPEFYKIIINYFSSMREELDKLTKKDDETASYEDFPYGKKLKRYAKINNLDYEKAVNYAANNSVSGDKYDPLNSVSPSSVYTGNQFLYRVAQNFAAQKAEKLKQAGQKSDWRAQWNKVLRDLGINSVADTQYSGHIHSGEPTQGVFMDPNDITLIATIDQTSHTDKLDYSGRPSENEWIPTGDHKRVFDYPTMRKGRKVFQSLSGKSSEEKYEIGILERIKSTINSLAPLGFYARYEVKEAEKLLRLLKKLTMSYNKLLKNGIKLTSHKDINKEFREKISKVIYRINSSKYMSDNPEIKEGLISKLKDLSSQFDEK